MLIFCLDGGDVKDAYAETEFGGMTEGKAVDVDVELGSGKELFGEDVSWPTADFLGEAFLFWGEFILCDANGDVDGFVEVVDPDDLRGGEQLLLECGLCRDVFDFIIDSEYSLDKVDGIFWFPFCDEELDDWLPFEVIILDSILLQALVSMAKGLIFESYCNGKKKNIT